MQDDTRYKRGEELLKKNRPDEFKNLTENFADFPDVGKYVIEFAYGDLWSRPGLGQRERALVTVSCLAALGKEPQLASHIKGALAVGGTKVEIQEALLHLAAYAGFPVAINGLKVAQKVFAETK